MYFAYDVYLSDTEKPIAGMRAETKDLAILKRTWRVWVWFKIEVKGNYPGKTKNVYPTYETIFLIPLSEEQMRSGVIAELCTLFGFESLEIMSI